MGIPVLKVFITLLRMGMRPINNMIALRVKTNTAHPSFAFRCFTLLGNKANRLEVKLNRITIGSESSEKIDDLQPL